MIFADIELAARIEACERDLVAACTKTAGERDPELSTLALPLGSGLATYGGPGSPLNKVVGLGFGDGVDEDRLAEIERAFAARDTPVQIELSTLADPGVGALLTRRGYVLQGFENVLALRPTELSAPEVSDEISIELSPAEEADAWLDTVVDGFAAPDEQGVPPHESFPREAMRRVIGEMTASPGFVRFAARRHGELAGGGSLRVSKGIAQLCGAATVPEHRRQGVQTALLVARLAHAARAECDLAVVTTMPGSRSQHNAQRRGFELLYARAILVQAPAA